jgi:hypothetical protein
MRAMLATDSAPLSIMRHAPCVIDIGRVEFALTAELAAAPPCRRQPRLYAFGCQIAFDFGQLPEHRQQKLARPAGQVDGFGQ